MKKVPNLNSKFRLLICASAVSVLLVSCGGGDTDDTTGGPTIIGTGISLEGTASSVRKFASNDIEIKSKTGERTTAATNNSGRFLANEVVGDGPFLLRADMGNNEYLYSIAHKNANNAVTQNIHSYTDAAARNWFASNGYDIDAAFTSSTEITALPTSQNQTTIVNRLLAIVDSVLAEYNLPNTDLTKVNYDADNTGVDLFLNNNPVLINNGSLTILVTDPESRLTTQSSVDVSLSTDLTLDDVTPPDAPTSLRALAASMSEMVIVWESAIDNIGVTAYQVLRDGELIATTPFPVYTDANLLANTQYSYTVVAIDSSGNASVPTMSVVSETLTQADMVAPPTPVSVMLVPTLNSFRVNWSQAEIFDVAAFNVYRSGSAELAQAEFKVTSSFITDASVLSGSQYCYQVSAVDASGNESDLSPIQCDMTSGSQVSEPTTDPTTDPVTTPGNGDFLAPTVDVSGLNCTDELDRSYNVNTVISAGCYLAPEGITVNEPANLSIEAGVVIKFGSDRSLLVNSGASLTAVGNVLSPIVFSSTDPTPGYWNGVNFFYSNSSRNKLDFVLVEYAGTTSQGANVMSSATDSSPTRLSISNTTVRYSAGTGFAFDNGTILEAFEGNLMVQNNKPATASVRAASSFSASSRFSGNASDAVYLSNQDVDTPATLSKLDVPYVANRITVDNALTIEPGVKISFTNTGELFVSQDGVLKALGTAADPILLTGTDSTRGFWNGVRLFYSNQISQIEHTVIEYGGAGTNGANLVVTATASSPSRLRANNLILRESVNDGFVIEEGAGFEQFDNIISTLNGRAGVVAASEVHEIGPGASFMGNDIDHLIVERGTTAGDVAWLSHDVPYVIDRVSVSGTLRLSAGSTLLMGASAELFIEQTGSLSAVGTAAAPILITGKESIPGYWNSIRFFYSPSVASRLEHVVVEYGGNAGTGKDGNIIMTCTASSPSRVNLDNVQLNFGLGWGMYADDEGCEVTVGQNVTYSSNGLGGFNLTP